MIHDMKKEKPVKEKKEKAAERAARNAKAEKATVRADKKARKEKTAARAKAAATPRRRSRAAFCFIDYAKSFDYVDHNTLWEILKEMGIPDHLISLLRNLYVGQEETVRTLRETADWFQIGK